MPKGIKLSPEILESSIIKEIRSAIKAGEKPLYRYEFNPEQRIKDGFDISRGAASSVEPGGLYFSDKLSHIPGLVQPDAYTGRGQEATISELKDYLIRGNWSRWRDSVGGRGLGDLVKSERGFITGVLDPRTSIANFNQEEWLNFVERVEKYNNIKDLSPKKLRNYAAGIPTDDYVMVDKLPKLLSERLLNEGYEAVKFPDTVARQPNLYQTVLLNQGNMNAMWRNKGKVGAGILGTALALMNKDEDHLQ